MSKVIFKPQFAPGSRQNAGFLVKLSMVRKIINFLKNHQGDIILLVGVILVSLLSFAMGYIAAKQENKEPIRFELNENSNSWSGDMRSLSCLEVD